MRFWFLSDYPATKAEESMYKCADSPVFAARIHEAWIKVKTQSNLNSIPLALLNTSARHSGKSGIIRANLIPRNLSQKAEAVPIVSTGVYWGLCALRICETYQNCMFWLNYTDRRRVNGTCNFKSRSYKTFFILNSAEHEIYPVHEC